ncbi:uncharacterized protein LOC119513920 isoform X1 [Choloepus didactylus]|uniref:uncharacterized protein LOC119513920 isoform X1 n=1 Tax=Choloepus didactylus TaxID=27675 RepID=UPI00189F51AE|nr:uncharacterized protein LOC119513920 isoform X1 [Choloepus didactylus]
MILVVKSTRSPEKKKQMEVTETTAVEILAVRLKWKSRGKPWRKLGGSFSLSPGSRRPRSEVRPARVLPNTRVSSYFEDKCRKLRMNSDWHLSASLLQSSGSCLVTGTSVGAHPYPVVMGCFLRGRSSLPAEQPCRAPPSGGNHCLTIESAESARKSILCPGPEDVLCSEINRNSPRIACRRMQGISPYGLITSPCALKNKPE